MQAIVTSRKGKERSQLTRSFGAVESEVKRAWLSWLKLAGTGKPHSLSLAQGTFRACKGRLV